MSCWLCFRLDQTLAGRFTELASRSVWPMMSPPPPQTSCGSSHAESQRNMATQVAEAFEPTVLREASHNLLEALKCEWPAIPSHSFLLWQTEALINRCDRDGGTDRTQQSSAITGFYAAPRPLSAGTRPIWAQALQRRVDAPACVPQMLHGSGQPQISCFTSTRAQKDCQNAVSLALRSILKV